MTIKWGDPIECNGVRPDWLRDDEQQIAFQDHEGGWYGDGPTVRWFARELDIERPQHIRLPADHPAYVALARGFLPWSGGESAPDDWDGGAVLLSGGIKECPGPLVTNWSDDLGIATIIGYRKRNTRFDEPHLARIEVEGSAPVEGVFIKRMTAVDIVERWDKIAKSRHSYPQAVVQMFRDLGLVQDESRAERFTRETGHAVTEAVEAALNWKGE